MDEKLDIVDESGVPTGRIVTRNTAHHKGVRHRTAHLWLVRKRDDCLQVLVQKRSQNKDSHPGCYDISSAGHIPAGSGVIPSALRELSEELGISAKEEELLFCGIRRYTYKNIFHGKPFTDSQVSFVYILWRDLEEAEFTLQEQELESVMWMDFDDLYKKVEQNLIPNCIRCEELDMILNRIREDEKI